MPSDRAACAEHSSYIIIGTGEPLEETGLMEFRLLFEGELLSSGNRQNRTGVKHAIRRSFHPQLRRLWDTHPSLRELANAIGRQLYALELQRAGQMQVPLQITDEIAIKKAFTHMANKWSVGNYKCIPLATMERGLKCSVDILLLRPDDDKFILTQGDIDGQVKTLFDALRLPVVGELSPDIFPSEEETPFYCLLEDDRMISEVRVTADQLLLLPHEKKVKATDSFAVITVKISHKAPGMFDQWFA
jgi:hypothetical protein